MFKKDSKFIGTSIHFNIYANALIFLGAVMEHLYRSLLIYDLV